MVKCYFCIIFFTLPLVQSGFWKKMRQNFSIIFLPFTGWLVRWARYFSRNGQNSLWFFSIDTLDSTALPLSSRLSVRVPPPLLAYIFPSAHPVAATFAPPNKRCNCTNSNASPTHAHPNLSRNNNGQVHGFVGHHDLATRNVQCVAQIVGSVKVAPEFSDDDILFFLE